MLDFFRDNFIVHTHVAKTAGSTLTKGLARSLGRERVWDHGAKRAVPDYLTPEQCAEIYVLAGHLYYDSRHVAHFDRTPIYIACVRPPLERYHSAYDFARVRPNHADYKRVAGKSLRDTVADLVHARNKHANVMARVLSSSKKIAAADLCRHVEEAYLIVTPHRRVNDTLNALAPLLGGRRIKPDLHKNKARERTEEDYGDMREWFEEANRLDTALVRYVDDNYDRWLKQLPERLEALRRKPSQKTPKARIPEPAPGWSSILRWKAAR